MAVQQNEHTSLLFSVLQSLGDIYLILRGRVTTVLDNILECVIIYLWITYIVHKSSDDLSGAKPKHCKSGIVRASSRPTAAPPTAVITPMTSILHIGG